MATTSTGNGAPSSHVTVNTTSPNPVPILILGIHKPPTIIIYDVDNGSTYGIPVPVRPHFTAYDARTGSVLLANKDGELYQLGLDDEKARFVKRLDQTVSSVRLDWIGRYLYFVHDRQIKRIDLEYEEKNIVEAQTVFTAVNRIKQMDIDDEGRFYYVDTDGNTFSFLLSVGGDVSELVDFRLSLPHSNKAGRACNCIDILRNTTTQSLRFFLRNHQSRLAVAVADGGDGGIIVAEDADLCICRRMLESALGNDRLSLQADFSNVYVFSVLNNSIAFENKDTKQLESLDMAKVVEGDVISTSVLCRDCQAMGNSECVKIHTSNSTIEKLDVKESSAVIKLPLPRQSGECKKKIQLPSTIYTVEYNKVSGQSGSSKQVRKLYNSGNFGLRRMKLENLTPNSRYSVCAQASNIYSGREKSQSVCTEFTTKEGKSGAPLAVKVTVLSPESVRITWRQPTQINSDQINYEVNWASKSFVNGGYGSGQHVVLNNETRSTVIHDLQPNTTYEFWMHTVSPERKKSPTSEVETIRTFSAPSSIKTIDVEPRRIGLSWINNEPAVASHQFIYYPQGDMNATKTFPPKMATSQYLQKDKVSLGSLSPSHCYTIKVVLVYKTNPNNKYIWPRQTDCVTTLKDKPLVPGTPGLNHTDQDDIVISWSRNEEAVLRYELQGRRLYSDEDWKTAQNDSKDWYSPSGLPNANYTFRVRAFNTNGYSAFSSASVPIDLGIVRQNRRMASAKQSQVTIVIVSCAVGVVIAVSLLYFMFANRRIAKKNSLLKDVPRTDLELAKLREIPIRGGFIDVNNPMYNEVSQLCRCKDVYKESVFQRQPQKC